MSDGISAREAFERVHAIGEEHTQPIGEYDPSTEVPAGTKAIADRLGLDLDEVSQVAFGQAQSFVEMAEFLGPHGAVAMAIGSAFYAGVLYEQEKQD
jgi:hypothetical protein